MNPVHMALFMVKIFFFIRLLNRALRGFGSMSFKLIGWKRMKKKKRQTRFGFVFFFFCTNLKNLKNNLGKKRLGKRRVFIY